MDVPPNEDIAMNECETVQNGKSSDNNNGASTGSTEATDVGDRNTTEGLLAEGKSALKSGDTETALEKFSEAVEKKLEELGGSDNEHHPDLGPFYLEYGNALLKNAENSSELFKFGKDGEVATQQPAENEVEAGGVLEEDKEEVSDEQLAWEILELARICYKKQLEELEEAGQLPSPKTDVAKRVVEDAAFVHLRLGDLLLVEEKFVDASEEFQNALSVLMQHGLPYTCRLPSTVALAQAQLFNGKAKESLMTFKAAFQLVSDQLQGVGGAIIPLERIDDFKATQEDLAIQIEELERNIKEGIYDETKESSSSSSTSAPTLLERTGVKRDASESPFDQTQLKAEEGETVLGVVKGRKAKARKTEDPAE